MLSGGEGWKLIHNVHRHDDRPEFELFDQKRIRWTSITTAAVPGTGQKPSMKLAAWKEKALAFQLPPVRA
jgi:hypothetical protein